MTSQFRSGGIVFGAALVAGVWALVPAAASAGKGKEHKAHGKVVSMTVAADGTGSITIQMHKRNKNAAAAGVAPVVETKTFQIGPNTAYQAVTDAGAKPVTLAAIRKGEHVVIEATSGAADKVAIVARKHKRKAVVVAAK